MRPRDEQKASKLQGWTWENGENEKVYEAMFKDIVEFPSNCTAGAVKLTANTLPMLSVLTTGANNGPKEALTLMILKLEAKGMFKK